MERHTSRKTTYFDGRGVPGGRQADLGCRGNGRRTANFGGERRNPDKLRFEEKEKMRQEREQRILPSNLIEEEKISQDGNNKKNRVARGRVARGVGPNE